MEEAEIEHLNNYQKSMFSTESQVVLTDDYTPVTSAGLQTLDGKAGDGLLSYPCHRG